MSLDRIQVKHEIILSLIKTAGFASLAPSAKSMVTQTADMLVDYIFAPEEKADTPAPRPSKKGQKETSPT